MEPFEANNNYEEAPLVEIETASTTATIREWPAIGTEMEYDEEAKIGLRVQSRPKDFNAKGVLHDRILLARKITSPTLLFLVSVLLGLDVLYFGLWMRLFDAMNWTMPRTFAWFLLLSAFGSVIRHGCDENCRIAPAASDESVEISLPAVPVLAMIFTGLLILLKLVFICFKRCRKTVLFYMKQLILIACVFVLLVCAISGPLLYRNITKLEDVMRQELEVSISSSIVTSRWSITQRENRCCGIYKPADWQQVETKGFPSSCCMRYKKDEAICQREAPNKLYNHGCYGKEYDQVIYYGKWLIFMTVTFVVLCVLAYVLSWKYYLNQKENAALEDASVHRVFMRQGSNFITFGGQNGNQHVIRKGGFMVETRGALASSSAINDHYISLEILNFGHCETVGITRETDRILISVVCTRTGAMRGKAVVTSVQEEDLAKVVVTPTASGMINIFL